VGEAPTGDPKGSVLKFASSSTDAGPRPQPHRGSSAPASRSVAVRVGLLLVLVLLVVVLAVRLRYTVGPLGVDVWVARHVVWRLPRGTGLAKGRYDWIARVGAPGFVAATTTLTLVWARRRRDLTGALLALVGPGLAFAATELVIKPAIARKMHRDDLLFIFPSGTVAVVAASAAATVVLVNRWAGRVPATLTAVALCAAVAVECVAVVEVGWHYATDVVGGLAVAGAAVLAVAEVLAAFERRSGHNMSAPTDTS
jgi:hypothetical protein